MILVFFLKREGDSESGLGKSHNGSTISRIVSEGSETLPVIYIGSVGKKLGQTRIFMEGPEYSGRSNLRGGPPWARGCMGPTPRPAHH
jgi:hypothetical protein